MHEACVHKHVTSTATSIAQTELLWTGQKVKCQPVSQIIEKKTNIVAELMVTDRPTGPVLIKQTALQQSTGWTRCDDKTACSRAQRSAAVKGPRQLRKLKLEAREADATVLRTNNAQMVQEIINVRRISKQPASRFRSESGSETAWQPKRVYRRAPRVEKLVRSYAFQTNWGNACWRRSQTRRAWS